MDYGTPSPPDQPDWRRLHALGLPPGSVRALLAILIFATAWALLVLRPAEEVPDFLRDLLFIILGHYFASRRAVVASEEGGPPPLYLPRGSVRLLLVLGSVAVAVLLWRRGELTDLDRNPGAFTLLLVGGFLLGVLLNAGLAWWRRRGHRPPRLVEDVKAVVSMAAAVLLAALVVNRLFPFLPTWHVESILNRPLHLGATAPSTRWRRSSGSTSDRGRDGRSTLGRRDLGGGLGRLERTGGRWQGRKAPGFPRVGRTRGPRAERTRAAAFRSPPCGSARAPTHEVERRRTEPDWLCFGGRELASFRRPGIGFVSSDGRRDWVRFAPPGRPPIADDRVRSPTRTGPLLSHRLGWHATGRGVLAGRKRASGFCGSRHFSGAAGASSLCVRDRPRVGPARSVAEVARGPLAGSEAIAP